MQVRQQCRHLRLTESPREGWHHSFAGQDDAADVGIRRRSAAGQNGTSVHPMEIGWNLLQREVILVVTMGAPHLI
jgi:hypothetical protein